MERVKMIRNYRCFDGTLLSLLPSDALALVCLDVKIPTKERSCE